MDNYKFNYNQYKKTIHKKNNFSFLLIIFLIIILMSACILLKPKNKKVFEYYIVEVDCFQTYQQAIELSNEINIRGGAGYIYFDSKYHVLASLYSNYDNAEKVCNNLIENYPNTNILTFSNDKFVKLKNLNAKQNNSIENLINATNNILINLETLNLQYDTNKINQNKLKISVKNFLENFTICYDDFLSSFKNKPKFNVVKKHTEEISKSLEILTAQNNEITSSNLKYSLISICINLYQFRNYF